MAPWHDGRTHGTGPELWVHWWKPTRHVSRGRNLDFCKFCRLFWIVRSVCPKRSIRCFGTQPFMWASASRDTSNESQALTNDALYVNLLRFEKEHHSATWLRNHHARTPGTFGHFSGVSFHESKAQQGPVFIEKSSEEWFGSDRQSMCFLKPLRCSTAISACATADLWKQSLQLFYVELIRLRPETWQKSASPFGWGVNSTKLDLSSTSQSCTESSSGNSAFKFYETSVTELHVEQRTPSPAIQLSVAAAAAGNGRLEPSYLKCHEFMVGRCLNSPQEAAEMLMAMPLRLLRRDDDAGTM